MPQTKRNAAFLLNRLKDMYGEDFDPIMKMAENANRLQKIADENEDDANAQLDANKEWERLGSFTTPKLKSVEMAGGDGFIEVHVHRK